MGKYGGLDLYYEDLKKIYIIDHEDIRYLNEEGVYLIEIPDEPSTNHEYFAIYEYLFYRILATYHNLGIILNTIS